MTNFPLCVALFPVPKFRIIYSLAKPRRDFTTETRHNYCNLKKELRVAPHEGSGLLVIPARLEVSVDPIP
jgi:hypothetical protein